MIPVNTLLGMPLLSCLYSFYCDCALPSRRIYPGVVWRIESDLLNVPVTLLINRDAWDEVALLQGCADQFLGWCGRKENIQSSHPRRMDMLSTNDDSDPRAAYTRQMENGLDVRMAILARVLGKSRWSVDDVWSIETRMLVMAIVILL